MINFLNFWLVLVTQTYMCKQLNSGCVTQPSLLNSCRLLLWYICFVFIFSGEAWSWSFYTNCWLALLFLMVWFLVVVSRSKTKTLFSSRIRLGCWIFPVRYVSYWNQLLWFQQTLLHLAFTLFKFTSAHYKWAFRYKLAMCTYLHATKKRGYCNLV